MKKILFILMGIVISMAAPARPHPSRLNINGQTVDVWFSGNLSSDDAESYFPHRQHTHAKKQFQKHQRIVIPTTDDHNGNLKVKFSFNPETEMFYGISVINHDVEYKIDYLEGEELTMDVEPGKYLILVKFFNLDESVIAPRWRDIIYEDVEISNEPTELTVKSEDANRTVSFRSVNSENNDILLPIQEDNAFDYSTANVEDILIIKQIWHEDYGVISTAFGNTGYRFRDGQTNETIFDFATNKVGDKIWFTQARTCQLINTSGDKDVPAILYTLTGTNSHEDADIRVENDPEDICVYDEYIQESPGAIAEKAMGHYAEGEFNFLANNQSYDMGSRVSLKAADPSFHVSVSKELTESSFHFIPKIEKSTVDIDKIIEITTPSGKVRKRNVLSGIQAYPAMLVDGEWIHSYYGNCNGNISFKRQQDGYAYEYPGNTAFTHLPATRKGITGNSAPILYIVQQIMSYETPDGSSKFINHTPNYIGRVGEIRNVDLDYAAIEVKRNGETVFSGNSSALSEWQDKTNSQPHESGVVEVIYNNQNIKVDDLQGHNVSSITYDEHNKDINIPLLQMLWFKDNHSNITDRFEHPSDGFIEISGGDFNYQEDGFYFEIDKCDITVEYAPYGSHEWEEIEVEEIPDNFYAPGYGYFWRVGLEQINRQSANGWYDLRVTLTDKAANTNIQEISPAFYINGNTGIKVKEILSDRLSYRNGKLNINDENVIGIILYNIEGSKVAVSNSNTLSHSGQGVYLVQAICKDNTCQHFKLIL